MGFESNLISFEFFHALFCIANNFTDDLFVAIIIMTVSELKMITI